MNSTTYCNGIRNMLKQKRNRRFTIFVWLLAGWLVMGEVTCLISWVSWHWWWCPASAQPTSRDTIWAAHPLLTILTSPALIVLRAALPVFSTLVSWFSLTWLGGNNLNHQRVDWGGGDNYDVRSAEEHVSPECGDSLGVGETVCPDGGEWQRQCWWWARWYWAVTESWPPASRHRRGWATTPLYHHQHHHHHHQHYYNIRLVLGLCGCVLT